MSSKYAFDVCHGVEYQNQSGEKKKRWTKIGAAFEDDQTGNISLKVEYIPVGTGPVFLSLFRPKDKTGNGSGNGNQGAPAPEHDGDVPF